MTTRPTLNRCPCCKRDTLRQQVNVVVDCAADCHNLSKRGIAAKDVKVMGVLWDQATWYCTESECGYIENFAAKARKAESK